MIVRHTTITRQSGKMQSIRIEIDVDQLTEEIARQMVDSPRVRITRIAGAITAEVQGKYIPEPPSSPNLKLVGNA